MVIFTTAYEQYAVESYKLEAIDYLLKPIDFESFRIAVIKAKKAISTQELETKEDYVFIKDGTKTIRLFYNQILYLKGCGNYVEFITTVGKYSSRMTITQLLTKLPETIFHVYIIRLS
jgi:two-component system, LytTR family, response regulator